MDLFFIWTTMQKNKISSAFTLIELLLVIAIIGILAGVVYAMIGNSDNSRRKAVLTTAKSIMPYAQECDFKGDALSSDGRDDHSGGGSLCVDSVTIWPAIGDDNCEYTALSGDNYGITCPDMDSNTFVCCNTQHGLCVEGNSCP